MLSCSEYSADQKKMPSVRLKYSGHRHSVKGRRKKKETVCVARFMHPLGRPRILWNRIQVSIPVISPDQLSKASESSLHDVAAASSWTETSNTKMSNHNGHQQMPLQLMPRDAAQSARTMRFTQQADIRHGRSLFQHVIQNQTRGVSV